jgi:hypothetical protein
MGYFVVGSIWSWFCTNLEKKIDGYLGIKSMTDSEESLIVCETTVKDDNDTNILITPKLGSVQ